MADFPDSTLLPKFHQALSRRSLMREMAAAGMLAAVPAPAVAALVAVPSPRERLEALVKEIQLVAQEIFPHIDQWFVVCDVQAFPVGESRCPFTIAAFDHPGAEPRPIPVNSRCVNRVQS